MRLKALLKGSLSDHPLLETLVAFLVNRLAGRNSIRRGKGNRIEGLNHSFLFHSRIVVRGTGNVVTIGPHAVLRRCRIQIWGDGNSVVIGEGVSAIECDVHVEDSRNRVSIGDAVSVCGPTHIAATEGTAITIGAGCLFSGDVTIRSGDSHSIVSKATGERINPARDVRIGDHVWIGNKVIILKGSLLGSGSIVASGSVVAGRHRQANIVVGGNPACVLRTGVDWVSERVPVAGVSASEGSPTRKDAESPPAQPPAAQ